jgi:hypothetical protein
MTTSWAICRCWSQKENFLVARERAAVGFDPVVVSAFFDPLQPDSHDGWEIRDQTMPLPGGKDADDGYGWGKGVRNLLPRRSGVVHKRFLTRMALPLVAQEFTSRHGLRLPRFVAAGIGGRVGQGRPVEEPWRPADVVMRRPTYGRATRSRGREKVSGPGKGLEKVSGTFYRAGRVLCIKGS